MNEQQALRDVEIYPSEAVLAEILGAALPAYHQLIDGLKEADVTTEWRYYKDGKAWLLKAVYKKKTLLWLSVWSEYFKLSIYFTERARAGIADLLVTDELKTRAATAELRGKHFVLVLDIDSEEQLDDVIHLVEYKKKLK